MSTTHPHHATTRRRLQSPMLDKENTSNRSHVKETKRQSEPDKASSLLLLPKTPLRKSTPQRRRPFGGTTTPAPAPAITPVTFSHGKETKRSEPDKTSLLLPKTPPLRKNTPQRRQPFQVATTPTSTTTAFSRSPAALTPPGSSKVLRKHFAQLSVTPQRRTKIQSGAIRVVHHRKKRNDGTTTTPRKSSPTTTPTSTKCRHGRIGYDGTTKTPSKELLRSTACTRGHQVQVAGSAAAHHRRNGDRGSDRGSTGRSSPPLWKRTVLAQEQQKQHDNDSTAAAAVVTVTTEDHTSSSTTTMAAVPSSHHRYYRHRRDECCDPVALILLNDGKEDLGKLVQQDASPPKCNIPKVSSSLNDIMDDGKVATLVRPIPRLACDEE